MSGDTRRLLTPEFRMSFPKLVTPEAFKEKGKAKGDPVYSVECIIDPVNFPKFLESNAEGTAMVEVNVKDVLVQAAKAKWEGISVKEAVGKKELFWPIVDGNAHSAKLTAKAGGDKKDFSQYKDKSVFRTGANQEYPPVLSMVDKGVVVQFNRASDSDMAKAKQVFKGGNYGIAEVTVKAVETPQGRYLKFYVNSIRMTRVGEPLGGGGGLMARYDGIKGGQSAHNPTDGMDDDIPY